MGRRYFSGVRFTGFVFLVLLFEDHVGDGDAHLDVGFRADLRASLEAV
jgi:hypothetical protein